MIKYIGQHGVKYICAFFFILLLKVRKPAAFFFQFNSCLCFLPFIDVSVRTQSLRCGILSSASTSGCQPIRSAVVIPPVFWETSSQRATIMSTSSCSRGELCRESFISSSWTNTSKALLAAAAAAAAGEAELQGEDYVSKIVHKIFARGEKKHISSYQSLYFKLYRNISIGFRSSYVIFYHFSI